MLIDSLNAEMRIGMRLIVKSRKTCVAIRRSCLLFLFVKHGKPRVNDIQQNLSERF
jgi:hypothetical protein